MSTSDLGENWVAQNAVIFGPFLQENMVPKREKKAKNFFETRSLWGLFLCNHCSHFSPTLERKKWISYEKNFFKERSHRNSQAMHWFDLIARDGSKVHKTSSRLRKKLDNEIRGRTFQKVERAEKMLLHDLKNWILPTVFGKSTVSFRGRSQRWG